MSLPDTPQPTTTRGRTVADRRTGREAAAAPRAVDWRPPVPKKKPYEAPRIIFREPLEGVAAVCGGTGKGDPVFCPTGPLSS